MTREDKILAIAVTMMISGAVAECFKLMPLSYTLGMLSVLFFFYWLLGEHN
jgi:hypothetical protein